MVMDTTVSDTDFLANIIKKILQCFEEWNTKASFGKMRYGHIDVTLSKNDMESYTIQVTNYGQSINDVLLFSHKIFWDFVTKNTLFKNSLIATIYTQTEHNDYGEILNLHFINNRLLIVKDTNDKNLINFLYQKRYLSFLLKNKLMLAEVEKFITIIIKEIILLQQLNSHTKFTVHISKKMLYNNYIALDNDYKSCQILVNSLTSVIKQSLDFKFKENCFTMLSVENSHEVETALMVKLLPLIHENYTFSSGSHVTDYKVLNQGRYN